MLFLEDLSAWAHTVLTYINLSKFGYVEDGAVLLGNNKRPVSLVKQQNNMN